MIVADMVRPLKGIGHSRKCFRHGWIRCSIRTAIDRLNIGMFIVTNRRIIFLKPTLSITEEEKSNEYRQENDCGIKIVPTMTAIFGRCFCATPELVEETVEEVVVVEDRTIFETE